MIAAGITAEYNPLHNGHVYHIQKTRELTGCDAVVVAMSGDYVQRGEPALMDKWTRANLALEGGADLVIEIPVLACLGNAKQYANASVKLLESLGCVRHISFGSECGDEEILRSITDFFSEHKKEFEQEIMKLSRQGYNYPVARARAYMSLRGMTEDEAFKELQVLGSPNDILGLEYISAIRRATPLVIKREGAGYSDPYDIQFEYQSASTLRNFALDGRDISRYVPEATADAVMNTHLTGPDRDYWFNLLRYAVMSAPAELIEDCPSGGEGLANLLKSHAPEAYSWSKLVRLVKSRRYTYTRISRLCMQIVLGIMRYNYRDLYDPQYVRVLGFNQKGRELLSEIRKSESSELPVITNINKERQLLSESAQKMLDLDVHAADIYNIATGRNVAESSDHRIVPIIV